MNLITTVTELFLNGFGQLAVILSNTVVMGCVCMAGALFGVAMIVIPVVKDSHHV